MTLFNRNFYTEALQRIESNQNFISDDHIAILENKLDPENLPCHIIRPSDLATDLGTLYHLIRFQYDVRFKCIKIDKFVILVSKSSGDMTLHNYEHALLNHFHSPLHDILLDEVLSSPRHPALIPLELERDPPPWVGLDP